MQALSEKPSARDLAENLNCQQCRADWDKTGPVCRHCRLQAEIRDYHETIFVMEEQGVLGQPHHRKNAKAGGGAASTHKGEGLSRRATMITGSRDGAEAGTCLPACLWWRMG